MIAFAWYLLKVMLVSGILFSYYWVALRNKKFHLYNRFYLLASILLSWLIPLMKISVWEESIKEPQVVNLLTVVATGDRFAESKTFSWDWNLTVIIIAVFISAIFFAQLIIAIVKIKRLISSNPTKKWNNINFVFTNTKGTPFSFFKYIFWNNEIDLNSSEGEQILKHELTHVHENHTADKIFLSVMLSIGWYNPFMWLARKELNIIHEFIADQKAVNNGDAHSFALMLLKTAYPTQHSMIINSFFHSPIKRRLIMLTTNRNPRYSYLRRLMILPLLTIVMLFFAFRLKEKKAQNHRDDQQNISFTFSDTLKETPQFPGGAESWKRYLNRNLDASVGTKAGAPEGSYKVSLRFKVDKEGWISNITALTKIGYGFEDEAIKLIKKGPRWVPAKKDNIQVDSFVEQDFYFIIPGVTVTIKNQNHPDLVVVDDKKLSWEEWQKMGMKPDQIQSVNVLKGESAIRKYGDKGKDGVIEITSKGEITEQDKKFQKEQKSFEAAQKDFEVEQKNYESQQNSFAVSQKTFEAEQNKQEQLQKYNKIFTKVENPPSYIKGNNAFSDYIKTNLRYPREAIDNKTEGKVTIKFIVNVDGNLSNFQPISSLGHGLENEAIRLIKNSSPWKPAVQNGRKVSFEVTQEIDFKLGKQTSTKGETPAEYHGGLEEWRKFFFRNTDFKALAKHPAPTGKYKVIVNFLVAKDGSISNVAAETKSGFGTEDEAIRTISKGPKWSPAKKDGDFVDTPVKQTTTYTVTKDGWSYVEVNSIIVGNVKTNFITS